MKPYFDVRSTLFIIVSLVCFVSQAQTKATPVVSIDLDAGTIGLVPFDQKFKFGSFKTIYDEIELHYEIDAGKLKKCQPNYNQGGDAKFMINKATGIATCQSILGPLHPNVLYNFKFKVTKAISLSTDEEAAYKKDVYDLIVSTFKDVTSQDDATVIKFKADLELILIKYAKSKTFVDSNGNPIVIQDIPLFKNKLNGVIEALEENFFNLDNPTTGINKVTLAKLKDKALLHFKSTQSNDFFITLTKAINNDKQISDTFKKLLDNPINAASPGNAALTVRQYLQYLVENPIGRIEEVLNGTKKIVGNDHAATNAVDKNSLMLLSKVFEILNRSTATDSDNKLYFSPAEKTFMGAAQNKLDAYIETLTAKETTLAAIEAQKTEIPNLLKDALVIKEITLQSNTEIDVLAEKNAYIGLDAGIGYAFGYANGFFIYQGANFYLGPVNRDAEFSNLEGWDEFSKRFSLYIGIAQIITEKEDSFENLLSGSSVLTGFGYRLNRAFRLNVGGLLHYKKDPNPVIDDKKITFSPTVSFSVDIDLIKALGAVGKALNIQ